MKEVSDKKFLSDNPDEFGSVSWVVKDYYGSPHSSKKEAGVRLTDCYKVITLDFEYTNIVEFKARKEKLRTLIESLEEFEREFIGSWGKR